MLINRLTTLDVTRARPSEGKRRVVIADGGGLYLQVTHSPHGPGRSWVFRYKLKGRTRTMGLGSANTVGLAQARAKARQYRQQVVEGIDPLTERDRPVNGNDCGPISLTPRRHRGSWAQLIAGAWLLSEGYEAFYNLSTHGPIDLIGLKDGKAYYFDAKLVGENRGQYGKLTQESSALGVRRILVHRDGHCEIIDR